MNDLLATGEFHSEWGADCDWGHRRQDDIGASRAPVHHAVSGRSDVGGLHWDIVRWVSVFIFTPSRRLTSVSCCVCFYMICLFVFSTRAQRWVVCAQVEQASIQLSVITLSSSVACPLCLSYVWLILGTFFLECEVVRRNLLNITDKWTLGGK